MALEDSGRPKRSQNERRAEIDKRLKRAVHGDLPLTGPATHGEPHGKVSATAPRGSRQERSVVSDLGHHCLRVRALRSQGPGQYCILSAAYSA